MDWTDILQLLPNFALALLALIIALIIWTVWRAIAPAAPGLSLGYYEIVGRQYGSKIIRRIKGTLVDSTEFFLTSVEDKFIQFLKEDLEALMRKQGNPDSNLKELVEKLDEETVKLSRYIRIVVTREKLFAKHVIIQYKYVDKPINAYAAYDPHSKFSLGFGFLTQGVITGVIHTVPTPYRIARLGKVQAHIFIPDVSEISEVSEISRKERGMEVPEYLAKLALYAPAYVELTEQLKAKDEMVKEAKRERQKADKQLAAHATLVDSLITAVQGFTTKFKPGQDLLTGKGFTLMDFITIAFPTAVGCLLSEHVGVPPIAGVLIGMLLGAFFVFRRTG